MIRAHRRWHRRLWWFLGPLVLALFVLAVLWRPQQPDETRRFDPSPGAGVEP